MGTSHPQTAPTELSRVLPKPLGADITPGDTPSPNHHSPRPYFQRPNPAFLHRIVVLRDACFLFVLFFPRHHTGKAAPKPGAHPGTAAARPGGGRAEQPHGDERRAAASGYGKTSQEPPEPSVPRLQPLREALLGVSTARASLHSPRASPRCLVSGSSVTSQKTELLLEPPPGARTSPAATAPPRQRLFRTEHSANTPWHRAGGWGG